MAQSIHINQNLPDLGGPFLYQDQDEKSSYSVETPYGFQLDLDFLKYVDDIQSGQTLKKVPVNRKPRVPRLSSSSLRSPSCPTGGWTSTESLTSSEDGRLGSVFFQRVRTQSGSSDIKEPLSQQKSNPVSPTPTFNLLPPPSPKSHLRNHRVEKMLVETSKRLEREQLTSSPDGQGRSCPSSNLPKLSVASASSPNLSQLPSSTQQSRGGESLGILSPSFSVNSGRSTPAASISSTHLQFVREQMATALRQLKDLEEQVKAIPVLEMKISTLEREKRELLADLEKSRDAGLGGRPNAVNFEAADHLGSTPEQQMEAEGGKTRPSKIAELKRLTEKLSVTERNAKNAKCGNDQTSAGPPKVMERRCKSIGVGADGDINDVVFYYKSEKATRDVAVGCEVKTQDVGVWAMESLFGLTRESEKEIELLQHTIDHQKGVICMLEGHLKNATRELEELRVAVCSRTVKNMADKEVTAQPQTQEAYCETAGTMEDRASGERVKMVDAGVDCSFEIPFAGLRCLPQARDVEAGAEFVLGCQGESTRDNLEGGREAHSDVIEAVSEPRLDMIPEPKCKRTLLAEDEAGDAKNSQDILKPVEACDKAEERITAEGNAVAHGAPIQVGEDERRVTQQNPAEGSEKSAGHDVEDSRGRDSLGKHGTLKSIMKNKDGASQSQTNRGKKSLQFVGILNGEYESTSSEESSDNEGDSSSDKVYEDSSESEEDLNVNVDDSDSDGETYAEEEGAKEGEELNREEQDKEPSHRKEDLGLSVKMSEASVVVNDHLLNPSPVKSKEVLSSCHLVQQEWFRVSSQKSSVAGKVSVYLQAFHDLSKEMLSHVVNLTDGNGNTALHYSVSHSNFGIVQLLLETGVCNVDRQNKAGYTAIMLAALAAVEKQEDMAIVSRLFSLGNVNAKASQAGQTALMLAVSHGRQEMVQALLSSGANVNLQDDEGSTALMCASEHGRSEIVKLLLAQHGCDVTITDNDGSNALSIALEAGQNDIAMLLYAHMNFSKPQSPGSDVVGPSQSAALPVKSE